MRPLLRLAVSACAGLTLAACGSTVPLSQQGTSTVDGLGGAVAPANGGGASAPGAAVPGSGSTSGGFSAAGTTGAAVGSTGAVSGSTGSAVSVGAVGSTKPLVLGIAYVKDAAAAAQAFGFQGATLGDMHLYAQVLVDDLNKRGGLGGRKVVPVFFGYDANPGQPSWPQQDASACAAFTQDTHVEVAIVTFGGEGLNECLRRKGVPQIQAGATGGVGKAMLARYPQLFVLGGFNLDRRAREEAKALVRQKYFAKWDNANGKAGAMPVKIGIITYNYADYTTSVNHEMVPAIVAAGYPKPDVVAVAAHDSYDNISKMQAQISNAVLSFRAAGVTHVIIWDDNGVSTLFFMQQAQSQKYRPRYGITSGNNLQVVTKVVSSDQLNGATGMGWVPEMDVPEGASPTGKYSNSSRRRCYALMTKAQATGSGFNETSAMMYCSAVFALEDRWNAMAQPTASGLAASFEAFGSSFVEPSTPSSWMSPTQHDGNGGTYDYVYNTGCTCMTYVGGVHPLAHG